MIGLIAVCFINLIENLPMRFGANPKLVKREAMDLSAEPEEDFGFAELPAEMLNAKEYKQWERKDVS